MLIRTSATGLEPATTGSTGRQSLARKRRIFEALRADSLIRHVPEFRDSIAFSIPFQTVGDNFGDTVLSRELLTTRFAGVCALTSVQYRSDFSPRMAVSKDCSSAAVCRMSAAPTGFKATLASPAGS